MISMQVYKEVKEIAKCNEKRNHLASQLSDHGFENDDIDWNTAQFVSLSKESIAHFKDTCCETEDYFVSQSVGYLGDDFYGYLYFKTDVPGQYVKVFFAC